MELFKEFNDDFSDAMDAYFEKFGEGFPIAMFDGDDIEETIKAAIASGVAYEPEGDGVSYI